MKIFKYHFPVENRVVIMMPKDAHILTVQMQRETPCIWAIVDETVEVEARHFRIINTGEDIDFDIPSSRYIGTFQSFSGNYFGHMFEVQ